MRALLLGFLLSATSLLGQDFGVYHRVPGDLLKMRSIPEDMTEEEYAILSRDIRMIDIGYAMIVPGYTHFKAQAPAYGYAVLAADALAAGSIYFSLNTIRSNGFTLEDARIWNMYKVERQIIGISSAVFVGAFVFDHIHGKWMLERKQERIRYKYAPRLSPVLSTAQGTPVYGVRVSL